MSHEVYDAMYCLCCANRNNARVVFAGSLAMFSNEYFEAEGYGNEAFCIELSRSVVLRYVHTHTVLLAHCDNLRYFPKLRAQYTPALLHLYLLHSIHMATACKQ
jgi:hypothetical protein